MRFVLPQLGHAEATRRVVTIDDRLSIPFGYFREIEFDIPLEYAGRRIAYEAIDANGQVIDSGSLGVCLEISRPDTPIIADPEFVFVVDRIRRALRQFFNAILYVGE